ncbi:radical SAM protein [candidate division CSSED10-310 bacterium]|uniref:Radical SAM protein n=1 Tax=candidate division CSSED10-310 bacterium TaxID=2855610 RepID=A0ABV6Z5D1_UNCC1
MKGDEFLRMVGSKPPFSQLHPSVAAFFKEYLSHEKMVPFRDQYVLNTHFPPFPSPAFNTLVTHFNQIGELTERRLFSVTLAVTNRCNYHCWHCYNADRDETDIALPEVKKVVQQLQDLDVVMVTLTGGEPLLRPDLEEIAAAFDTSTCLNLNTTGDGLTDERARKLKESGVFGVGVSLDSTEPQEHDRLRGKKGAFDVALKALELATSHGLYPYIIAVTTHEFLEAGKFEAFMEFAARAGAREVHLLEPSATGRLSGNTEILLTRAEKDLLLHYQKEMSQREDLPILSSFAYLESPEAFGCGAGLTHLYIDGSGQVCPCNLVPLSFGDVTKESLEEILEKMGSYFQKPRCSCVGITLAKKIPDGPRPTPLDTSITICEKHLSTSHRIPRFFQIRAEAQADVGPRELQSAYDKIHAFYDEFWVVEAGKPVVDLLEIMQLEGPEHIFEAGCGTGFATKLLSEKVNEQGSILAADLSPGMLDEAKKRFSDKDASQISFVAGDALEIMQQRCPFDIIFSSWVLGYIPLIPFFTSAYKSLADEGYLAFIVHKENSPREPLEIFAELVAQDPAALLKRVAFDFPPDSDFVVDKIQATGFTVEHIWDGNIVFTYHNPEQVLEHLLKSGAGTAFYDAIASEKREDLEKEFMNKLISRHKSGSPHKVIHDYIACIARKPGF